MKNFIQQLIIVFSLLLPALSGLAASQEPLSRKVLALYESSVYSDPASTLIHRTAELTLNYLGLQVEYRPVESPLPSDDDMQPYIGFITWFTNENAVPHPDLYCQWMRHQIQTGKKIVLLENWGLFQDKKRHLSPICEDTFKKLGIEYKGEYADNPYFLEVAEQKTEWVEFERKINFTENLTYSWFKAIDPQSTVYLKVRRTDMVNSESDMVVTTPQGGFVAPTWLIYNDTETNHIQWRVNPFLFFEKAFDVPDWPRPDTTTLNGNRIFYSHIDGDGIFNISKIDQKSFSGEVILNEILKQYPSLPITLGLITGYMDLKEFNNPRTQKLYREMIELPQVEIASHGYAHPLVWKTGELSLKIPDYNMNAEKEINGSIQQLNQMIESLGITYKKTSLFQWTGDCTPSAIQIKMAEQTGLPNLNGGGGRQDDNFYGLAALYPIGITKEGAHQIYAGAFNENNFTNLWSGPYYGFAHLLSTLDKTENPLRLKAVDVYYHFYSGERWASLKAVKKIYDSFLNKNIFPIHASQYARIAEGFYTTEIKRIASGHFVVSKNGVLQTIRFDHEKRNLDLSQSTGVLGFIHDKNALYVSLDESENHVIQLSEAQPSSPYLIQSTFQVSQLTKKVEGFSFQKQGWLKSHCLWGGLRPNHSYRVITQDETQRLTTSSTGELKIDFQKSENGLTPVLVRVEAE